MSSAGLPGLLVAYAAMLAVVSWVAERLPAAAASRGWGTATPWAHEEALRFRKGMARVVRVIAAFLLVAVLARFRATAWAWPAGVLLVVLAVADVLASRRAPPRPPRRGTPPA